jgi:drug/metabolite transporter (DMT)-like permease
MSSDRLVLCDLALLTLFSTVLATHWLVIYQPRVPANRAAVIYLLESVFAAAFAILWGYDRVTLPLALGGTLIVTGVLLVELPPAAPRAAAMVSRRRSH